MSSHLIRPLPLALAACLAAALPVRAQSLLEVYEAARAYDATYLAARAQAESVQYVLEQSRAGLRPRVDLSASSTRTEIDPPRSALNPGGDRRDSTTTGVTVNARQPLFNRTASVTIEQTERRYESSKAVLQAAEQALIVRVAQAYFDVLVAQDALAAAQGNKKAVNEQLASAKRNFEVGTATITDQREAQAKFDLAVAQELVAENDLRAKRIALDQLVGRSNVTPKPLATPVALPVVAPANVEDWVTPSQSAPSVRRAAFDLEIAQFDTALARAEHLPTVDAVAALAPQRQTGSASQLPGNSTSASIGVQLAVPLFRGYATQNRIREKLTLEEKAKNDLEAERRAAAQNTRVAFFNVQSGEAQAKAFEAAESSSKLALEATQLGYRVGVRVNLDVLNAQTQLFNTQRDLSRARYDVLLANLRLRQAAGTLQPADVAAINTLLAR